MRRAWYVKLLGVLGVLLGVSLLALVFVSEIFHIPEPGVDRAFLKSLQGKLLVQFSCPNEIGVHLISLQDSLEPVLSFNTVDERRLSLWPPPDLSFDGKQIAAQAAVQDGVWEIFVTRIDSIENSGWQQVTHDAWPKHDLAWSPDGTQLAFSARAEDTNEDGAIDEEDAIEIYTINIGGSNLQQITFNGGRSTDPRWSPNGKWMVYRLRQERAAERKNGLYLINLETGESRDMLPALGSFAPVSWSPDSRFIAIAAASGKLENYWLGSDICSYEIETGTRIKLTDTYQYAPYRFGIHLSNPVWSPDGAAIAFAWKWDNSDKRAVFVVSHDGERLSQLTDWSECAQIPLSWRP